MDVVTLGAAKADAKKKYAEQYASAATAANTRRLVGKLRRAVADASILVISDSTGNSTNEWVYLTAQSIAAQFPAWGVQVAFWNETTNTEYQAPTVVQAGSNGRMLTIWNCAKSGEVPGYVLGFRWPTAVAATSPDLVFVSHGHNMGDSSGVAWQDSAGRNDLMSLTEEIAATFPRAGIVLIAQNPSKIVGRETWQAIKANVWEELASLRGYGFIDVHQAFVDYGAWQTDLMQDDTHPNSAGSIIWASAVTPAFRPSKTPSSMVLPPPPLLGQAKNYLVNGDFSAWTGAAPDSWAMTLATASKDTTNFETGTYGMKVTASASSGTAYAEQGISLASAGYKHLQGQVVTAAARVFVPAGNTATVRVTLLDSTGSANARETSVSASTRDRFVWVFASKRLDAAAGGAYVRLTARTSGTSTVEATFDRATLVRGVLPGEGVTAIKGDTGSTGAAGAPGLASAASFDFLSTLGTHPMVANALASGGVGVASANEANLLPVKPQRDMTVTRLRWVSHTPSGNYDIGIYDAAGNRLWSKGSTAMASGQITETVSPSVTLTAGNLYYIAFAIDNTSGLVRGNTSQGGMTKLATGAQSAVRVGVSMPLPATITPGTTESVRFQLVTVGEA